MDDVAVTSADLGSYPAGGVDLPAYLITAGGGSVMAAANRKLKQIVLDIGGTEFQAQLQSWTLNDEYR
jgi:hypothetical protein